MEHHLRPSADLILFKEVHFTADAFSVDASNASTCSTIRFRHDFQQLRFFCSCKEKLELIAKSGANVVLSRLAIGDLATQHLSFNTFDAWEWLYQWEYFALPGFNSMRSSDY